ncbi:MAG: TIGR03086 family metal-binding protein [Acidimicrobiales bacterium]
MSELVEMFDRSTARFGDHVRAVADHQWAAPTPCEEWDVRALVNHVVGEQLWAPHLIEGSTMEEVGDRYDGDLLGDDPVAAWDAAVGPSVAAFAQPGALDRTVHLSYGDEACSEYLLQMLTDAAVHGWDLARAIGTDATIDDDIASHLLGVWTEREALLRGSGVFAEPVPVADDADATDRLVALLGRRP